MAIDVSKLTGALRAHGMNKVAAEVRRESGVAPASGLVEAIEGLGVKVASNATDRRAVRDGILALAALKAAGFTR